MVEPVIHPVNDRPVGEQRRETFAARLYQIIEAGNIQEAFVPAGEAGCGRVFGGGGTADRDRDVGAVFAFQHPVSVGDPVAQGAAAGGRID